MISYDESLEVSLTVCMVKYTLVFSELKRSIYGNGSDAFKNNLEYGGQFCYIPTGHARFRNSLDNI